jgi:protein TonB
VETESQIFTIVEEMPSFPGGEAELYKFLAKVQEYPQMAVDAGIQGTVFVTFVVDKDGKVKDPKVLRGLGGGLDEAAIRMVKKMPPWEPGRQRGEPVRVQYNLPIRFTLK